MAGLLGQGLAARSGVGQHLSGDVDRLSWAVTWAQLVRANGQAAVSLEQGLTAPGG